MRRLVIIVFGCLITNAFALKCPVREKGAQPRTLYEKYCDPTEDIKQKTGPSKLESDQQARQARQERFLGGVNKYKSEKIKTPAKRSKPGYELPKPFVPPTQTDSGTWDYLK